MKKRNKKSGRELFEEYYTPEIIASLTNPSQKIVRFASKNKTKIQKLWKNLTIKPLEFFENAFHWPPEVPLGEDLPGLKEGLIYIQNASSLLPVLALDPQNKEIILDACAAPGGKASMISEISPKAKLTVCDSSPARLQRLLKIFQEHKLPKPFHHCQNAATLFKKYPEHFDRILIDAPCSSEKHVYNSEKHLNQWSPSRIKQLHHRQLSLINGLFIALKPGGRLVYSTCAINQEENQKILEKFLKKNKTKAEIIPYPQTLPGYSPDSQFGQIDITAKNTDHFDPMFIAIIQKNGI